MNEVISEVRSRELRVDAAIAEYLAASENGAKPDHAGWLARHADLASELEEFLADHERLREALAPLRMEENTVSLGGALSMIDAPAPLRLPHGRVGDYELLEEIARGGMGIVFKARQRSLNRLIAIKMVLGSRLASGREIERFHREAEAAAGLDHPNIVPIYEVGEHDGVPYFSMKLIEGGSLAEHRDRYRDDPRAAARLLTTVAHAVHHAHQRGILHRDLKPSNILLDEQGEPHVADFGLAKNLARGRIDGDAGDQLSLSGAIVGTPSCMSPEQARGDVRKLTTSVDVYGLGAILYQLLAGQAPFRGDTAADTLLLILTEEPTPPSNLGCRTPRDLETICMKCLSKEAAQRYGSAEALAQDLERFLAGEPIAARPVGRVGRARRWCQRNPAVACLLGTVAVLLLVVAGISALWTVQMKDDLILTRRAEHEAVRQRDEAVTARASEANALETAQKRLRQIEKGTAILSSIFTGLDPRAEERQGRPLRAVLGERLDRAAQELEAEDVGDPLAVARLKMTLGDSQHALGYAEKAIPLYASAITILSAQLGPEHPDTLVCANNLALAYHEAGNLVQALPLSECTLQHRKAVLDPGHPAILVSTNNLALVYQSVGKYDQALPLFEETFGLMRDTLGKDHPDTLTAMNNLAWMCRLVGRTGQALTMGEEALALAKATLSAVHPTSLRTMTTLAFTHESLGNSARAAALLEEVLSLQKAELGTEHRDTLSSMSGLAQVYRTVGRHDEAIRLYEQALAPQQAKLGQEHRDVFFTMSGLGNAYVDVERLDRAIPLLEKVMSARKDKLGPEHPDTLLTMSDLALAYRSAGKLDRALPLLEEALRGQTARVGADHADTLRSASRLAVTYDKLGRIGEALPIHEKTLKIRRNRFGLDHPATILCVNDLAMAYRSAGQHAQSLPLAEEAAKLAKARLGPDDVRTLTTVNNLGLVYQMLGKSDRAAPLFEETLKALRVKAGPDRSLTLHCMLNLATAYLNLGELGRAMPLFEEALRRRQACLGPDHPDTLSAMNLLGVAYWKKGRFDLAVPLFEDTFKRMKAILGTNHPDTVQTMLNLGINYRDAGRPNEALPLVEAVFKCENGLSAASRKHFFLARATLADLYDWTNQCAKSEPLRRQMVDEVKKQFGARDPKTAGELVILGSNLLIQQKWGEAEQFLREAVAIRDEKQPADWITFNAKSMLGGSLLGQKKYAEAEPLLLAGHEGLKHREAKIPASGKFRLTESIERLAQLYKAIGDLEKADEWRLKLQRAKAGNR